MEDDGGCCQPEAETSEERQGRLHGQDEGDEEDGGEVGQEVGGRQQGDGEGDRQADRHVPQGGEAGAGQQEEEEGEEGQHQADQGAVQRHTGLEAGKPSSRHQRQRGQGEEPCRGQNQPQTGVPQSVPGHHRPLVSLGLTSLRCLTWTERSSHICCGMPRLSCEN